MAVPVRPRVASLVFLIVTAGLGISALAARGMVALGTDGLLDWDETYYASMAATAAHGLGLYPFVLGYERIPHMGGIGYVIYFYVLAYKTLGPHLWALRLVSFLASLLAVGGLLVLARMWYGSAAALATLALAPSLLIFRVSNTIRLDAFALAFVAWALVLYTYAAARRASPGMYAAVGFIFALGLQVHLHTVAAALAVGGACLVATMQTARTQPGTVRALSTPVAGFAAGYALGAVLFLAVNVLPQPQSYFRTAALARLAADSTEQIDLTAPMDRSRLTRTFFSPGTIVAKEMVRYRTIAASLSWWEAVVWLTALPAFFLCRRAPGEVSARALLAGAVVAGAMVFNSPSPVYAAAIFPFFVPAAATVVTHGFGTATKLRWTEVSTASVAFTLLLAVGMLPAIGSRAVSAMKQIKHSDVSITVPADVALVHRIASPGCVLAGPTELYAQYFMAYPKFVGTRQAEVEIGSTYHDMRSRLVEYWRLQRPDIVFGTPPEDLATYLRDAGYSRTAADLWMTSQGHSAGCAIASGGDR